MCIRDRHTFDLASHEVEEVNKKERFHRNYAAITVLKRCQEENRFATPDEQIILSKYVGFSSQAFWIAVAILSGNKPSSWFAREAAHFTIANAFTSVSYTHLFFFKNSASERSTSSEQ